MSDDFILDTDDLTRRMDGALANLRTEFASLRTGRGSASMLDPVMVDAYGSMTPIAAYNSQNVSLQKCLVTKLSPEQLFKLA